MCLCCGLNTHKSTWNPVLWWTTSLLCVCILRYLCPICYSFKFQIKGLCVTWVALISCQKTRNVSTGFLVLVRLQQGQLFVPYHSEKCLSWMAWLSLLYQAFRLQRFVELHLPTSREGEAREILILKWMDKGKYSVKLTNWQSWSVWVCWGLKFAEDCEVCAVVVLLECNTSTRCQNNLLVCSELL